jgi:hypothetical protein
MKSICKRCYEKSLIQPENYAKLLELEANTAQLKLANKWKTYLHTIIEPIEGLAIPGIDREAIETVIGKLHVSSNFFYFTAEKKMFYDVEVSYPPHIHLICNCIWKRATYTCTSVVRPRLYKS